MSYRNGKLACDMREECCAEVSHIDDSGFVYCAQHGAWRKQSRRCRKLKPAERKRLLAGMPLKSYAVAT